MRKIFFILLIGLHVTGVAAQEFFIVYSVKGNVTVIADKKESKARIGNRIAPDAMIRVPAAAAITLICDGGGTISITEQGDYDLIPYDHCDKSGDTLFANYTKFFLAQFVKDTTTKWIKQRKEYFPKYAVFIGHMHEPVWTNWLFETVNYSGKGNFPLSWENMADDKKTRFSLYKSDDISRPYYDTVVRQSQISIQSFIRKIKPGSSVYWGLSLPDEESDMLKVFNYVSAKTYDSLLTSIRELKPSFEGPAEEAFRIAFMLESEHYFAEAYTYYKKAVTLAPANKIYGSTLMAFKKDYEIDNR